MVPSVIVVLDALPLNANGKVDRKALPTAAITSDKPYEAPQGPIAETIAAIWAEVLQMDKVGTHDNFFDLGGHSLLLVRVHRLLEDRLRTTVALVQLFKYPTVGSLAQWMARGADAPAASSSTAGDDRALRQRAALLQRRKSAERVN
jgi:acyl carrier protein